MYNYNYYQNGFDMRNSNTMDLYSPEEGYNKGNMFANLYSEYKNYRPKQLKANNEKEAAFLELSRYAFALHDIKLYLDVNKEDNSMIELYNDYNTRLNNLIKEYENKYGQVDNNLPWEGEMI